MVTEYKQYLETQRNVTGATSEFEKRYTAMIGSAGVKWEKFKAQLQAMLIVVGAAVIPAFERLGGVLQHGIDWARNNRGTVEFVAKATLAVAVASLLAGTFLKLYGAGLIVFTGLKRIGIVTGGLLGMWARVAAVGDAIVGVLGRIGIGLLAMGGRGTVATGVLGGLTARLWLATTAISTMNITALRSAFGLGKFAQAAWLLVTAITSLNIAGVRAALSLMPLAGMLAKFAKIGVITIGINVVWNMINKQKRDRTGFLAKRGLLGSAALEAIFGTDFGTSKWFATKETKDAIDEFDRRQKGARKTGLGKIQKNTTSDVKNLLAQIKKDIASTSGDIFNAKMFKQLGIDPAAINKQVNDLINKPPGADDSARNRAQMAKDIVSRTKDLLSQASNKLVEVYQGFREANQQAFGSIFEPMEGTGEEEQLRKAWNWTSGSTGLLNTMKARLAQFRAWRGELAMLLKKGFSKDFVEEFKKMGPDGLKYIDELKKAGPKKVAEFNQVMAASKTNITKATEIDFNAQLKKWNSFGKDTAFKIITGMESEEQSTQTRMNNMVERLYSGVAATIATQQVKLDAAAQVLEMPMPTFKVGPKLVFPTTPKPAPRVVNPHGVPPPPGSGGKIPFWWREDQAAALPGRARAIPADQVGMYRPQTGEMTVINVNGTFLTPQEMMDAALRKASHKLKHKR